MEKAWRGFKGSKWQEGIDIQDFIKHNYTEYVGGDDFLEGPTEATTELWETIVELKKKEIENGGVLDADTSVVSTITSHPAGYIDKDLEKIVGLQTEKPLKRGLNVYGGIRMAETALKSYGYEIDPELDEFYTEHRKTHNQGVFDAYDDDIRMARRAKIVTGLPDAYGRGRIIPDFRRIALYGVDYLMKEKLNDWKSLQAKSYTEDDIRLREEVSTQYRALGKLIELGKIYGFDISRPAETAQEAVQWVYLGFLAMVKEDNGAAQGLGRIAEFLDIYIERDLQEGTLTEKEAQELIDHMVMKARIVRQLRTPDYEALFAGDPTWATLTFAGMLDDEHSLITKNTFRFLQTLYNMGNAPEPNMTLMWSEKLPKGFKDFCAKVSIDTSAIQYENDDVMRDYYGSNDVSIACCVSPTAGDTGSSIQYFGARASLPKILTYAVTGGYDEKTRTKVIDGLEPITDEYLDYDTLMEKIDVVMDWVSETYVRALNIIHYMHDKYAYEAVQFGLLDTKLHRMMATGIAGIGLATDSVSAVKYSKVRVVRDEEGFPIDYVVEGEQFPTFGNNEKAADEIADMLIKKFVGKLKAQPTYRNSEITTSILTITSNIVYGKATGPLFSGQDPKYKGYREEFTPLSPGANPSYSSPHKGALAALKSVGTIDFEDVKDGASYTWAVHPKALGKEVSTQIENLTMLLDGYFANGGGHHLNVNVFSKEGLEEMLRNPENYPQATIRVSGYALELAKATKEQIADLLERVVHGSF
ncbi:Formate acetyltransferase [Jeotgalibaca dankookensis]|uniref:Formate acetyltransferase n=1 Tax=Jeotgalibaca dankookensis TaxID=708126 RepID=A0A1S6IRS9_9LACT|nr:formate C-acetyltransferase [Jeotgalibaca dankookensis]AQS54263.1 Formate acetyltransferase [Jeotgalibaca dankookensis]